MKDERADGLEEFDGALAAGRIMDDEASFESLGEQGDDAVGEMQRIFAVRGEPAIFIGVDEGQDACLRQAFCRGQQLDHGILDALGSLEDQRADAVLTVTEGQGGKLAGLR